MRLIFTCCGALILVITVCLDTNAQENATAVVTPSGEILYYSTPDLATTIMTEKMNLTTSPKPDVEAEFKTAIEENAGMKDFLTENPDLYVATGSGNAIYGIYRTDLSSGEVEPVQVAGTEIPTTTSQLDTRSFLGNLANNLFSQTQLMTCGLSLRPTTVEGSISVGVVSFSANWEIEELCGR